jgi:hypothetical protein
LAEQAQHHTENSRVLDLFGFLIHPRFADTGRNQFMILLCAVPVLFSVTPNQ